MMLKNVCTVQTTYGGQTGCNRQIACPPGFQTSVNGEPGYCYRVKPNRCLEWGNPIQCAGGEKTLSATDISNPGELRLEFKRTYSSVGFYVRSGIERSGTIFGPHWRHNYQRSISVEAATSALGFTYAYVMRADGDYRHFKWTGTQWAGRLDADDSLQEVLNGSSQRIGWTYRAANNDIENYDANGVLLSIVAKSGQSLTMTYSDAGTPLSIAPSPGLLIRVTDSWQRSLNLAYSSDSKLASVTNADGSITGFRFSATKQLAFVDHPGGGSTTYLYNEPAYAPGPAMYLLTGVLDENGSRFATYTYTTNHRKALSSTQGNSLGTTSVTYGSGGDVPVTPRDSWSAVVMDRSGTNYTKAYIAVNGEYKESGTTQPCGTPGCSGTVSNSTTYDTNGNVASRTDFNNKKVCYAYNLTRNLETARVEGLPSAATCGTELGQSHHSLHGR